MNKPKVLMLGWEIPPYISGGLGVACFGICQALASLVNLTAIFPRKDEKINIKGALAIGLDQLNLEEFLSIEEMQSIFMYVDKEEFLFSFSPYLQLKGKTIRERWSKEKKVKVPPEDLPVNIFRQEDIYDQDIMIRVRAYTKIITLIADIFEFDIIHAHDWMTFAAGVELKKRFNKPLVLHVHSLDYDRVGPLSSSWLFGLEKEALEVADLIIPVSQYTGKILEEHYQVPRDKIIPVHNAIEPIEFEPVEKTSRDKIVLFVGRITHQKGPKYFLKTALKVLSRYKKVKFIMVGAGDYLIPLMEEYDYKKLKGKIEFTGYLDREKVFELMAIADVFCMTSVSEPFGIVALEAAQFKVPIILSKRAGVAEVLPGALISDYWDINLMASQIIRLLKDPGLREKAVKQNLKSLKTLTWKNSAKKIEKAYQSLLTRS